MASFASSATTWGGDRGVWQIVDLQLFTLIIYIYNLGILTNLQTRENLQ